MYCEMDHIVLNVNDTDTLLIFYSELLQLEAERLEEFRQGMTPFPSVRLNKDTVIKISPKNLWQKEEMTSHCNLNLNHFCLALTKRDWDMLQDALSVNGITINERPVTRWGAHGSGTSIYFQNPGGYLTEARCYHESAHCLLGS